MKKQIMASMAALVAVGAIVLTVVLVGRANGDSGKLSGTWRVVQAVGDGKDLSHTLTERCKFIFSGNTVILQDNYKAPECEFKVDAGKKPNEIDLTFKGSKETVHGVYEIDGETLRIAYSVPPGAKRPVDFSSKSDDAAVHIISFKLKKQ